jgi:hypothetical protein
MRTAIILSSLGLALGFATSAAAAQDRYGRGYDPDGEVVRCESRDGRRRECGVDTRGSVQLVRQHSDAPCIRGRTWGSDGRGIWVDRGCRADFAVGGRGHGNGNGYGNEGRTFRCESDNHRSRQCETGTRGRIELVRQLSDVRCIEGRTWGQQAGRVWVDAGCRGEFRVAGRGRDDWSRWRGNRR